MKEYDEHSMRRVVVTGLSAITPIGASLSHTWRGLINGKSGLVRTPNSEAYNAIPSRVAGLVPLLSKNGLNGSLPGNDVPISKENEEHGLWNPDDWLSSGEQRRMAKYTQYAIAAAEMALQDAGWIPEPGSIGAQDTGVCLGSGIGNFEEVYDTSVAYHKGVRPVSLSLASTSPL